MRKYVIGGLVGAALMFGIQAGASGVLNGSKVAGTKDVTLNGKSIGQAAIINNSSYLPVRSISDSLGLGIDLTGGKINLKDAEKPTATATNTPAETPTSSITSQLVELTNQAYKLRSDIAQYNADVYLHPDDQAAIKKRDDAIAEAEKLKAQIEELQKQQSAQP